MLATSDPLRGRGRAGSMRTGETRGLGDIAAGLSRGIYDGASEAERARYRAAERRGEVFAAWNAVCGGTREGAHVTGLHYVPESNELVVYLDGAAWTQEMAMLREIIRARMAARGVDVAGFIFKTSPAGYRSRFGRPSPADKGGAHGAGARPHAPSVLPALTADEERMVEESTAGMEDERLREAAKKAMRASIQLKKSEE